MDDLAPFRFRSAGLWLAGVRAEVQVVKKAHRKPCHVCKRKPAHLRLLLRTGSGRSATQCVLCKKCGSLWVEMTIREGKRALRVLEGDVPFGRSIRLGASPKHQTSIWLKRKLAPEKKKKEPKS